MNAAGIGYSAFREAFFSSDPQGARSGAEADPWDSAQGRRARYALNWALYSNDAYSDRAHAWSTSYKAAHGLYKHVRHVYNPAYQIGEFYGHRLLGGRLDEAAGDGDAEPTALPILTRHERLRPAIARIWRDSRWQVNKEIYSRWGSVLGDVVLRVIDDPARGLVKLEVVHPGHLAWVGFDSSGNVKAYDLERWESDPRPGSRGRVKFVERARRDGDFVTFETLLNGEPYPWNGTSSAWEVPYGFVPMVIARHEPVGGSSWANNAFYAGQSRFREVDDVGSKLTDHIRKATEAPMLLINVKEPDGAETERQRRSDAATGRDRSRERQRFLHAGQGGDAKHLTFPLDYAGACKHVGMLLEAIEKMYPELTADVSMSGQITAEAIALARDNATDKVQTRRPGYEGPLVAAQQMALAIGGYRGYPGYEGFGLGSYESGDLDHSIGPRPVFGTGPAEDVRLKSSFWAMIAQQIALGIPLEIALANNGWKPADIARLAAARAKVAPPTTPAATEGAAR